MTDRSHFMPRRLDDMPQLFFWDADVAVMVIVFTLLGALFNAPIPGILAGLLLARGFSKIKHGGGKGMVIRCLYWYTPSDWWIKTRVPSWQREFVG